MIIERRMTKNPVTISPDANVVEASELMKKEKVHRLPVLDKDKKLVGVISEKDILFASPSPASSLSIHEMAYLLSKLTVRKLMTKDPVTITKDTTVEEAARLMVDQDLSCLPVVEGDKLVGIVSLSFLVDDKPGTIAAISRAVAEKGWDIISFGTFMGTDPSNAICTIKVEGCSQNDLVQLLRPMVKEILDVREV